MYEYMYVYIHKISGYASMKKIKKTYNKNIFSDFKTAIFLRKCTNNILLTNIFWDTNKTQT